MSSYKHTCMKLFCKHVITFSNDITIYVIIWWLTLIDLLMMTLYTLNSRWILVKLIPGLNKFVYVTLISKYFPRLFCPVYSQIKLLAWNCINFPYKYLFLFCLQEWNETKSHGASCSIESIEPAPDSMCVQYWWNNWQRNTDCSENNLPSATLSTTNHTWTTLGLNPISASRSRQQTAWAVERSPIFLYIVASIPFAGQRLRDKQIYKSRYWVTASQKKVPTATSELQQWETVFCAVRAEML
jgi:hypothetical protein